MCTVYVLYSPWSTSLVRHQKPTTVPSDLNMFVLWSMQCKYVARARLSSKKIFFQFESDTPKLNMFVSRFGLFREVNKNSVFRICSYTNRNKPKKII